jgi:predicted DNA-binding transcriptional regulator AlpA
MTSEDKTYDETFLSLDEVRPLVGNPHRVTIFRWIRLGTFPAAVRISPRKLAWRRGDIDRFLKERQ